MIKLCPWVGLLCVFIIRIFKYATTFENRWRGLQIPKSLDCYFCPKEHFCIKSVNDPSLFLSNRKMSIMFDGFSLESFFRHACVQIKLLGRVLADVIKKCFLYYSILLLPSNTTTFLKEKTNYLQFVTVVTSSRC